MTQKEIKAQHIRVAYFHLDAFRTVQTALRRIARHGCDVFGEHGALISGGFYEDWPEEVKQQMRKLNAAVYNHLDAASREWVRGGRRMSTFRRELAATIRRQS